MSRDPLSQVSFGAILGRAESQKLMIGIDQGWREGDRVGVFAKVER